MSEVKKCWFCGKEIADEKELFEYVPEDSGPLQYWHVACAERAGVKKSEKLEKIIEELETLKNPEYRKNTPKAKDSNLISLAKAMGWVFGIVFLFYGCAAILDGSSSSKSFDDITNEEMNDFMKWQNKQQQQKYDNEKFFD